MSEDQDDTQKTEEPTPRKLEEARKKGQVAQSKEVANAFMIFGGFLAVMVVFPYMGERLSAAMALFIDRAHDIKISDASFTSILQGVMFEVGMATGGIFLILVILALLSGFVQNGLLVAPENLKPKLERISILKGFKRLFSLKSTVEFIKGIAKLGVVAAVSFLLMRPMINDVESFITIGMGDLTYEIYKLTLKLLLAVLSVVIVIAGLDWLYQRFEFMKSMKMSRQDLKDEFRQTEGDPMVKSKLRQIRQERSRQRMMASVPNADVIITNPTHYAIALEYDGVQSLAAPKCLAKGVDDLALRIREVAKENDVPIVENPPLARAMYEVVEVDEEIPEEHYKAVAEIIAYVFKLKGKMPK